MNELKETGSKNGRRIGPEKEEKDRVVEFIKEGTKRKESGRKNGERR
jgi:hypothetical protein